MDRILTATMNFLCKNKSMDDDEAEIIRYGLELLLIKISFSFAILIMSIFINSFWECLVFLLLFPLLRSNAGGYHASTRTACFISSMLSVAAVLTTIKLSIKFSFISLILVFLSAVSVFLIWKFAPLDTENKPLDNDEKAIFRRRSRIIMFIEIIIAALAYCFDFIQIQNASLLSIILTAGLLTAQPITKKAKE